VTTQRLAEKPPALQSIFGLYRWTTEQEDAVIAVTNVSTFQQSLWGRRRWKKLVAESCTCGIPVLHC